MTSVQSSWFPQRVESALPGECAVRQTADSQAHLTFVAPHAGVVELSAVADARSFDWESLYIPMDRFGNKGQRTGPWDFDLRNGNRPLVPSFWASLDGKPLGLWYFARVSLQDMGRKAFSGTMKAYVNSPGVHTLTLRPYHSAPLPWHRASLSMPVEPAPALSAAAIPQNILPPAAQWASPSFWAEVRRSLGGSKAWLAPSLAEALDWAASNLTLAHHALPLIVAHARLNEDAQALSRAVTLLRELVEKPHWGNPDPAGYGHNGDHAAAEQAHSVAWSLHTLADVIPADLRAQAIDKLALQFTRFIDAGFLSHDYWGGSVLQDHGWRAWFTFTDAAAHALAFTSAAKDALDLALARVFKSMQAMPTDGAIPWSSYGYPYLYVDAPARLRDTLLHMAGFDLYDHGPWRPIISFLADVLDESRTTLFFRATNQDDSPFIGGAGFCLQMSRKHACPTAHALGRISATRPAPTRFYCSPQKLSLHLSRLDALLADEPPTPPTPLAKPASALSVYEDSGLAQWKEPSTDAVLVIKCGPFAGWHAQENATGPCDRMQIVPDAGHFALLIAGQPFFCSPEHGYRLHTFLRSCLLINGQGQIGDIGYPMSIPSYPHPGHRILSCRQDAGTTTIVLDLLNAYPVEAGLTQYHRTLTLGPGPQAIIEDQIASNAPCRLSWLFQTRDSLAPRLTNGTLDLTGPLARLALTPCAPSGHALQASLHPTDVVWSYDSASGHAPCSHARYDLAQAASQILMRFELAWASAPNVSKPHAP